VQSVNVARHDFREVVVAKIANAEGTSENGQKQQDTSSHRFGFGLKVLALPV
jgi:hypothetical protein